MKIRSFHPPQNPGHRDTILVASMVALTFSILPACSSEEGSGNTDGCSGVDSLASEAEVSEAGRADADAEILALRASQPLVAPTDLYERVSRDLAKIRRERPDLADIHARDDVYDWFTVELDEQSFEAYENDSYDAWNCANEHYGAESEVAGPSTVLLRFEGKRYRIPLLVELYEGIEGVVGGIVAFQRDASNVCMFVHGDRHRYLFAEAFPPCDMECARHEFLGFEVTRGGSIAELGSYCSTANDDCPDLNEVPDWFTDLVQACSPF